jgi:hypothetical protein
MQQSTKSLFEKLAMLLLMESNKFHEYIEDEDIMDYLEDSAAQLRKMLNDAGSDDDGYKDLAKFALLSANKLDSDASVPTIERLRDQFLTIVNGDRMKEDKAYNNAVLIHLYPFYTWMTNKIEGE